MEKSIVLGVSKINSNEIIDKCGDDSLAVVVKNEGKKVFLMPKVQDTDGGVNLVLTKRDLRELAKLVKDGEDEDGVEIKLLVKSASV